MRSLTTLKTLVFADAMAHGLWDGAAKASEFEKRCAAAVRIQDEVQELMDAANDPAHYAEELADVVIMALSTAGLLGIDIEIEVDRKMLINRCRPYQHREETT